MKIRTGFVSNSSSSSFIVDFPRYPETKEILAEMMGDCSAHPYSTFISSEDVIDSVWRDIKHTRTKEYSNNVSVVLENNGMEIWDRYEVKEFLFSDIIDNITEETSFDELELMIKEKFLKIKTPVPNRFYFSYSDEDGCVGSAMEHGNIFRNVPHERESHH